MRVCLNLLLDIWMKPKMNLLFKYEFKSKTKYFSHIKLKFQPGTQ